MIEARQLVKRFGPTLAVDAISFTIPQGQIVGFLGPNGAGKTTTLRMLTGYLPPTSGSARIAGLDVLRQSEAARDKIGYMPENTPLYGEMRVCEYLDFRGRLHAMPRPRRRQRIDTVVDRCGLSAVRRRLVGQLSRGNRQRVGLAAALLHDPPVLILDEPTAGLDPNQITEVRKLLKELAGSHTILVSTHILPEVEKIANRIMIIARGRIVAEGLLTELRDSVRAGSRVVVELTAAPAAVCGAFKKLPGVRDVETETVDGWCRAIVTPDRSVDVRAALGRAVAAAGWPIREMRYEQASLEQFFIQITAEQDQAA